MFKKIFFLKKKERKKTVFDLLFMILCYCLKWCDAKNHVCQSLYETTMTSNRMEDNVHPCLEKVGTQHSDNRNRIPLFANPKCKTVFYCTKALMIKTYNNLDFTDCYTSQNYWDKKAKVKIWFDWHFFAIDISCKIFHIYCY